jgi:hypothetical protein
MDTRRMLTAICFAMAAVLGWQYLMQYLAVKNHWTVTTQPTQAVQSTTQPTEAPVVAHRCCPRDTAVHRVDRLRSP